MMEILYSIVTAYYLSLAVIAVAMYVTRKVLG
jgi:hypothetical protein